METTTLYMYLYKYVCENTFLWQIWWTLDISNISHDNNTIYISLNNIPCFWYFYKQHFVNNPVEAEAVTMDNAVIQNNICVVEVLIR